MGFRIILVFGEQGLIANRLVASTEREEARGKLFQDRIAEALVSLGNLVGADNEASTEKPLVAGKAC